jgi:hypothetical protein
VVSTVDPRSAAAKDLVRRIVTTAAALIAVSCSASVPASPVRPKPPWFASVTGAIRAR